MTADLDADVDDARVEHEGAALGAAGALPGAARSDGVGFGLVEPDCPLAVGERDVADDLEVGEIERRGYHAR